MIAPNQPSFTPPSDTSGTYNIEYDVIYGISNADGFDPGIDTLVRKPAVEAVLKNCLELSDAALAARDIENFFVNQFFLEWAEPTP